MWHSFCSNYFFRKCFSHPSRCSGKFYICQTFHCLSNDLHVMDITPPFSFFLFLASPCSMRDLSFPTRDQTRAPRVLTSGPPEKSHSTFFMSISSILLGFAYPVYAWGKTPTPNLFAFFGSNTGMLIEL